VMIVFNFLAFDFKQNFRHLSHLPLIVLRWNWLRINPFVPPPGVDGSSKCGGAGGT
jgi:hypothetical protein